jgi:hypothetical protein
MPRWHGLPGIAWRALAYYRAFEMWFDTIEQLQQPLGSRKVRRWPQICAIPDGRTHNRDWRGRLSVSAPCSQGGGHVVSKNSLRPPAPNY